MKYFLLIMLILSTSISFATGNHQVKDISSRLNSREILSENKKIESKSGERADGGIYNSSAKIVIDSGAYVVVSGGNYQSEGTAGITDQGTLKLTGNLINNNTSGNPVSTSGILVFNGSSEQQISENAAEFGNVTLDNSSGLSMSCAASVAGNLTLTSGNLNLNGQTITLGETASLNEGGGRVYGTTGQIQTTRTLSNIDENVAGLGAEITTSANMGSTTITRCHTAQTGAGETGIQRYYDITPSTNTGLDATLVFHYNDDDISGYTESSLSLLKSVSPYTNWTEMGGTVNEANNTITLNGIGSFSRWTASDGENPLPVILSSFYALYSNDLLTLNWATETETNNLGWNIYRSLSNNPEQASQINTELIEGAGSTSEPTHYSYVDESDVEDNTTYWYWLESTTYGGETDMFGPVILTVEFEDDPIIDLLTETELFGNYPNPFNPVTEIKFNVKENETAKLTIFDVKGRVVVDATYGQGEQSYTWEANTNASGVYYYKLESPSLTSVKKMLLLK